MKRNLTKAARFAVPAWREREMHSKKKKMLLEKFSIGHPKNFIGNSLSSNHVHVLEEKDIIAGMSKCISLQDLSYPLYPSYTDKEELAYQIGDGYFTIQVSENGYDYTFYDREAKEIDGGKYDDPDISISEAADILLKEEGMAGLKRKKVDYDELIEQAEQAAQKILREAREQVNCISVISDDTAAEAALNGMSRSEIEETVWAIAQAEIMEEGLDAKIQAVRVYDNRIRDELYQRDSDVDVVIAYEGSISEAELQSLLNTAGYRIGSMKLYMNPIRPDETGTIKDFFAKSE